MQAYVLGPTSTSFSGSGCNWNGSWCCPAHRSSHRLTAVNIHRDHYAVLGVLPNASSSDIKRAYRLLALKYHPDVNKGVGANEAFKSIRLAYEILIDETRRSEYDRTFHHQETVGRTLGAECPVNLEYEDRLKFYRWASLRRKIRRKKYWQQSHTSGEQFSFYDDIDEMSEEENPGEERSPFVEVLRSAFLSLFLLQTVGARLSLTFSSLMAMVDQNLDAGYKFGYLLAWILGGRGGILLTMFLSFASWLCGKTSSSVVAVVIVALWFGSNLARYAPIPQGAVLTLLYMSIKLQIDLN